MEIFGLISLTILAIVTIFYFLKRINKKKKIKNNKNTIDSFVVKAMASKIASDAQKHRKDQEKYNYIKSIDDAE